MATKNNFISARFVLILLGLEISVIQRLKSLAYPKKCKYQESGTSKIGNDWK